MLFRSALLGLLLLGTAFAFDSPPAVLDNQKLFSKQAIDRVAQIAADLKENHHIDLCIETMNSAPSLPPEKIGKMRFKAVTSALRAAAQSRADDLGVEGIYVMITTQPKHVTIVGWPEEYEQSEAVSKFKREELRKKLSQMAKNKNVDSVLVQAIEQYYARVREPARPSPLQLFPAILISGLLLGVWLLLRLLRAGGRERIPIYQPAMLGSIFGVPASFWINDRLFETERPIPVTSETSTTAVEEGPSDAMPPVDQVAGPEH